MQFVEAADELSHSILERADTTTSDPSRSESDLLFAVSLGLLRASFLRPRDATGRGGSRERTCLGTESFLQLKEWYITAGTYRRRFHGHM